MHHNLIAEFAGGEFGPITVAEQAAQLPTREAIALNQAQVDQLLGYHVDATFIADALTRLGCELLFKLRSVERCTTITSF